MQFQRDSMEGVTELLLTLRQEVHSAKRVVIDYDRVIGYTIVIGEMVVDEETRSEK